MRTSKLRKTTTTKGRPYLTRKQKAFADTLLNNPKMSATKAALATYGTDKDYVAKNIASENLTKPNIQLYLDEHINKAKNRIVTLIDSEKEEIALRASDSVLDRSLGKATQRTENTTEVVQLNLTLHKMVD